MHQKQLCLDTLIISKKIKLSTKRIPQSSIDIEQDIKPEPTQHKCNKAYVLIYEHADSNILHADQTSNFSTKSIRGHK